MENIYEREDAIVGGAQELLASAGRNAKPAVPVGC